MSETVDAPAREDGDAAQPTLSTAVDRDTAPALGTSAALTLDCMICKSWPQVCQKCYERR